MNIACLGGGPAGLYFALLAKKARPDWRITLYERNRADDTFGWGVVFSEETLDYLGAADPETQAEIRGQFAYWSEIRVRWRGEDLVSGGHGFCGIMRKALLGILQRRAAGLGVDLRFEQEIPDAAALMGSHDLVVAGDGINSRTRTQWSEHFGATLDQRRNKYIWFGATRPMDDFLFSFRETPHGLFWCHAYRFDAARSTFIVECAPETWAAAGLDQADEAASIAFCEAVFAEDLAGARLLSNRSAWINFRTVRCETWRRDNLVLVGDAAHTAHFSIGSGTKLAMEDAIALKDAVVTHAGDVPAALAAYEDARRIEVLKIQRAAQESLGWFEHVGRYAGFEPLRFVFSLMNRSKKVSHENLRLRDPELIARVDALVATAAERQTGRPVPQDCPPMFTPFRLRDLVLENRVVVSPMCMYSAEEGVPNDWHLVHLGARAVGGAGLVYTEMTNVSRDARITPGCAGIWTEAQAEAWARIVRFAHERSAAKICLQLGHAGRKGSTKLLWEGMDLPLDAENWPLLSASPIPYLEVSQIPREMTRADMDQVVADFAAAAERGARAGFDMVEVHLAHGYLLSSFLSPLTNRRTDAYGGPIDARARFPLEVFAAVRAVWPAHLPVAARISATDWAEGGFESADRLALAALLKAAGCDLIDVSAGQTVSYAKPAYGRCFQTPFADEIRNEAGIATMAVGAISTWDEVNSIIAAGRADLCALARPHLDDPYWTLHAAKAQGWTALRWPPPYSSVQPRPKSG